MVTVKSNAAALLAAVVSKGITFYEAAQMCGVSVDLFGKCARRNKIISAKTAGRLQAIFGDAVITIE